MVDVLYGAGELDRTVSNAVELLQKYRSDSGYLYYVHKPVTDSNHIVLEDLAVTLLVNSQASWRAARAIIENAADIDLTPLPDNPLEYTTEQQRTDLAKLIARVANWPGFAASTATKVLHKKRPALIPILDNQAIFGAYLASSWPARPANGYSVKDEASICRALKHIHGDLTRSENDRAWQILQLTEPRATRIELFDMVWWQHFRTTQPVSTFDHQ